VLAASDSLSQTVSTNSSVGLNDFFQTASLHTVMQAAFALDVDVIGDPGQALVQGYRRPFKRGERSPLYLKLLQICPESLQRRAVMLVSTFLGIDISMMEALVGKTLKTRLAKIRSGGPSSNRLAPSGDILEGLLHKAHTHLSERALLKHAMTTMAASYEMISNELSWAIYALSHPDNISIQDHLRDEIRTHFPSAPTTLAWDDMSSLPYLSGVVNEVLRLYPNVSHRGRVCISPTTVLEQSIPKGTILTWPVFAINRDPAHWGPNAHTFNPERWLLKDNARTNQPRRDLFAFMTFGQGPHKCPGQHYTHAAMACMLFGLIGRFKFQRLADDLDVIETDAGRRVGFGIVMKADIQASVTEVPEWDNNES
jgi:cytochrome P450